MIKVVAGSLTLMAIILGFSLPITLTGSPQEEETFSLPGVKLGLTAEARQALQADGNAFPSDLAGFSVYHQVPGNFNKEAVDSVLFNNPTPTPRRAGVCTPVQMGENFTAGNCPIINIDALSTTIHVYYDTQGWVVAYLLNSEESSRAFQARSLDAEDPALVDISQTTLLDALNEILIIGGVGPRGPENVGYYHWSFPNATHFLLFGTARGIVGADNVSFVLPVNTTPLDATISQWISKSGGGCCTTPPCARIILDGNNVTGDQCNRQFSHHSVNPPGTSAVHNLTHDFYRSESNTLGASGAALMLLYSTP
jgi:hypothetical protein